MKKIMNCTLVSVLIITLLTSVFPGIDVLAIDSEAAKKTRIVLHSAPAGNLPSVSITRYTKLKSYYKKALKQLKKQNPKLTSDTLYGKAYLNGYEAYICNFLDRITTAYEKKGWTAPSQPLNIYIHVGSGEPVYMSSDSIHGSNSLTIYTNHSSFEKLQHNIAHEVFHWFQSTNSNISNAEKNRWQTEMLADYAPRYAVLRSDHYVGEDIGQDFLKYPLTYDPDSINRHKYHAAQLLKYIDKKAENFDLSHFGFNSAGSLNESGISGLENFILTSSGKSLLYYYRYFASYLLFSPSSPVTFSEAASHSIALRDPLTNGIARAGSFDFQNAEMKTAFLVSENYSSEIWALTINFDSSLNKTQTLSLRSSTGMTSKTSIDIYKAKSNYQSAKRTATILDGNSEVHFSVKNGDKIYIVVANGEPQPRNFDLTLSKKSS